MYEPKPNRNDDAPLVPQDTCIVHENGDAPKCINGALDDSRTVRHRRRVHDSFAARCERYQERSQQRRDATPALMMHERTTYLV